MDSKKNKDDDDFGANNLRSSQGIPALGSDEKGSDEFDNHDESPFDTDFGKATMPVKLQFINEEEDNKMEFPVQEFDDDNVHRTVSHGQFGSSNYSSQSSVDKDRN